MGAWLTFALAIIIFDKKDFRDGEIIIRWVTRDLAALYEITRIFISKA